MSEFAVMPLEDYVNTCDAVREKTGSEEVIKSGELASEVEKVFEAGERKLWERMIASRTASNGRVSAQEMFRGWQPDYFYPKVDIKPYSITSMFDRFGVNGNHGSPTLNLKERLEECGHTIDFSEAGGVTSYVFYNANITVFPEIHFTGYYIQTKLNYTFDACSAVEWIDKLVVLNGATSVQAFRGCTSLRHLILECRHYLGGVGKIKGNWDFSYSPLDVESMKSIISCLYDYSGKSEAHTYSILFPEASWEALEADSTAPTGTTWKEYVDSLGYIS